MAAAAHTEPTGPHTKDELLRPGHDHHLNAPPCPDPSIHRTTKLQEQASTAALYVTKPKSQDDAVLDAGHRLSSRSAAQSLKYARPEDLPSYPVVGINTSISANAAANLAASNQKPFEHWKPDISADASKAAMLAKDYKMAPMWKPELSAAGSKAALLAHKDGGKLDLWMPQPSADGNSAAIIALRQKTTSPQLDYGYTEDGHRKALVAATGAINRSKSQKDTPPPVAHPAYPDSHNSAQNALNAATIASSPSVRKPHPDSNAISSDAMRAARIQNYGPNVNRQLFTERPPVEIELEEKRQQAALRASAISMAKQLYDDQEKRRKDEETAAATSSVGTRAATTVHGRALSTSAASPDVRQQALQYIHLQEAAQKLAQERLAKLDPDGVALYKAHYGYDYEAPRNRLSLRGRTRRRADSESTLPPKYDDDSSDDEFTSRRIRNQMSGLNNSVAEIDAKKRAVDRAALLAAAERKVQAQMHSMDEKVYQETGKVSPAMMEEWEAKARARAAADSEGRQKNHGKINIGGGKYMNQAELEAIAQERLQPTLNEISETAEKRRAADEERRLDDEENKRKILSDKERQKEIKAEQKRLKAEEKAEAKAQKQEAKAAEKARKAEEKRARETDKHRFEEVKKEAAEGAAVSAAAHEGEQAEVDPVTTNNTTSTGAVSQADGTMRPNLDRHVSTVLTSSSEGSDTSDDDSDAEPGEHFQTSKNQNKARAIAERATGAPVVEESTAAVQPMTPTSPRSTDTAEATVPATATSPTSPEKRKSKGLSGFFGKFKRRSQAPNIGVGGDATSPSIGSPTSDTHNAATSNFAAAPGTDAVALAKSGKIAGPAADADLHSNAASTSSFRRHEAEIQSISSLSSSDDESRRRGRLGKTSAVGTYGAATASARDQDEEDEGEAFEEARDHFDEALAPPPPVLPAFALTERKSAERETRFQEDL